MADRAEALSIKTDLERSIGESYSLIREYEDIIRLSDRPKEKLRAKREMEGQWALIEGSLAEYSVLAGEDIPDPIREAIQRIPSWREDLARLDAQVAFGSWEQQRAYRNRSIMLKRVRDFWIKGVLEQSLYHIARIDLAVAVRPEAVEHPLEGMMQQPNGAPHVLVPGARAVDLLDEWGQGLLILGAPGSGKTTLLLELADELLDRAQSDVAHPIPVVLNLSSWAVQCQPLPEWLVDELNRRYDVPRKVGRAWVADAQVLPLLDGLDEVARARRDDCVQAINAFRQEYGFVPLVVCSREAEYSALSVALHLPGALSVEPLSQTQVGAYLARAGAALDGVRKALEMDEGLWELLDTPLMLSVMALAYRNRPGAAAALSGSMERQRWQLFAAYVDAMFRRRSSPSPFPREQTEHWLAWLAAKTKEHGQSLFYLEEMQADWLASRAQRRFVTRGAALATWPASGLIAGALIGLGMAPVARASVLKWSLGGLAIGLILGLLIMLLRLPAARSNRIQPAETLRWSWSAAGFRLRHSLAFALAGGLSGGAVGGVAGGLVGSLVGGLTSGWTEMLVGGGLGALVGIWGGLGIGLLGALVAALVDKPVLVLRTSRLVRRAGVKRVVVIGLVGGLLAGVYAGLVSGLVMSVEQVYLRATAGTPGILRLLTAMFWLRNFSFGLLPIGVLFRVLRDGLITGDMSTRSAPNQGIRRSARNALLGALAGGLSGGLIGGSIGWLLEAMPVWGQKGVRGVDPLIPVLLGSVLALVGVLIGGPHSGGWAYLQHLVLRFVLWKNDLAPRRYVAFLDEAAGRILLRKVGGGYLFVHRLLQDYFAALWEREG